MEARSLLLFLLPLSLTEGGCATRAERSSHGAGPARELLVAFDPRVGASITPEILSEEGRGDYALAYVLAPGGASVETTFRGPSEALGAGLWTEETVEGNEHVLVGGLGRSGFQVPLARWKIDASGRAFDVRVRTEPVVEIRPCGERAPGQLVVDCEWRPWIDGKGVGEWRQ